MPLQVSPELKLITPYVRRAEELDRDKANPESRLVAYYCRQYAVHLGIPSATSPAGKNCLGLLLGNLEEEKAAMDSFTRDEAKFLCQKFAHKIFDRADLEDRDGNSTKATAKTFYAAASFLEMLQQFYKDDDEAEEIQEIRKRARYAKWKATEMLKAFREGRQPTPGEYGADSDAMIEGDAENDNASDKEITNTEETSSTTTPAVAPPKVETASDDGDDEEETISEPTFVRPPEEEEEEEEEEKEEGTEIELGPPPAFDTVAPPPVAPPAPSAPVHKPPLTFTPPPVPPPMPAPPVAKPQPPPPEPAKKSRGFFGLGGNKNKRATKAELADAKELTRFALAALEDRNADLAADRLRQALQALGR